MICLNLEKGHSTWRIDWGGGRESSWGKSGTKTTKETIALVQALAWVATVDDAE